MNTESTGKVKGVEVGSVPEKSFVEKRLREMQKLKRREKGKKKKEILRDWRKNIDKSKQEVKKKLVGGEEKHKNKLEAIEKEYNNKLKEIREAVGVGDEERLKQVKELEKKAEKKIDELTDEIEKEAKGTNDESADGLAKSQGGRAEQVWEKIKTWEKAYSEFDEEMNKFRPNIDSLIALQEKLVNGKAGLIKALENWDGHSPLEVRVIFETEVSSKIRDLKIDIQKKRDVKEGVRLLEVRESAGQTLRQAEMVKLKFEIEELKKKGQLTEEEISNLNGRLERMFGSVEIGRKIRDRAEEKEYKDSGEALPTAEEVARLKEELGLEGVADGVVYRLAVGAKGNKEKLHRQISEMRDESARKMAEQVRQYETETRQLANDQTVENLTLLSEWKNGKYDTLTDYFKRHIGDLESPLSSEAMMKDAKRYIVGYSLKRIAREGENAELRVTNEDLENWMRGRLELVMASGGDATGFTTRNFLQEVSWIASSKDLNLREIINEAMFQVIEREGERKLIFLPPRSPHNPEEVKLGDKVSIEDFLEQKKMFVNGDHATRVSNEFRENINAALTIYEINQAYKNSYSQDDPVRAFFRAEPTQVLRMLEFENPAKEVRGRLKFFEVVVGENGKRATLRTEEINGLDPHHIVKGMHSAELSQGELALVVKVDGREIVIKPDEIEKWLMFEGEVSVKPGEVLDLLQQERFITGMLSTVKETQEIFETEVIKEAILVNRGLIDVDGELQIDKLQELVVKQFGSGAELVRWEGNGKKFDIVDGQADRAVRMSMVANKVGIKDKMNYERVGENTSKTIKRGKDEKVVGEVKVGGWQEDKNSLDDVFNEHMMVFNLAEGFWQSSGMAVSHAKRNGYQHNVKEWHWEMVQFPWFLAGYGIGPAHFWDCSHLDFGDFITQSRGALIGEIFNSQGPLDAGKETKGPDGGHHREDLIKMVMLDRDGFLMTRQKLMDLYGLGSRKEIEKRVYQRLLERAEHRWGKVEGQTILRKHFDDLKTADWSGLIKGGGKTEGFEGLANWAKQNYHYNKLGWGMTNPHWNVSLGQYANHLASNRAYMGKKMAWMKNAKDIKLLIDAVGTPINYGNKDKKRQLEIGERRVREYYQINVTPGESMLNYDPHSGGILGEGVGYEVDEWDGTVKLKKRKIAPGICVAKMTRGIPSLSDQDNARTVEKLHESGLINTYEALEKKARLVGTGATEKWINLQLDKAPLGLGKPLKLVNHLMFGKTFRPLKVGNWQLGSAKRWDGVLGWMWKWLKKWIEETLAVRKEIARGVGDALKEQAGKAFQEGVGGAG